MPPGGSYQIQTYTTHPWVFEDFEGTVYAVYVGAPLYSNGAFIACYLAAASAAHAASHLEAPPKAAYSFESAIV
jgi:hypothetical protein